MNTDSLLENLQRAKKALEDFSPCAGMLLKTGIGEEMRPALKHRRAIPCSKIPGFPQAFRENELVFAQIHEKPVVVLEGGPSFHQGIAMRDLAFPIWLFAKLGAEFAILTAAAGSLDARVRPGGIFLVKDHLNFMGTNPLLGLPTEALGPLFPDLSKTYDRSLATLALRRARREGIPLKHGVVVAAAGPALETDAEKRFYRAAGAQALLTSLVPEAIAATHAGLRTLALAAITDSCWPKARAPISIEAMLAAAEEAAPRLERLLLGVLQELPR